MKQTKFTARKRIMASASMLVVSAIMLSSATYAWFTMSREVEVQNIQLTATTPEDIQLSLGAIANASETDSLAANTGYLSGSTAAAPTSIFDWANTADVSHYYSFGKLIPASSTNGVSIFFTPDADGVGRTVKANAGYYAANNALTPANESTVGGGSGTLDATAHINSDTAWTYADATAWNVTNDDGYYVDIPVWLRTSSLNSQQIYVVGYVTDKTAETGDAADADDLYKAVRVAILTDEGVVNGGCLALMDGGDGTTTVTYPATIAALGHGILDSANYNGRTSGATAGSINALSATTPTWAAITENQGATNVATLPAAAAGSEYGAAVKVIVRVWLEGEDGNCWNENAGQDWNICLKFMKDALPASGT